MYIIDGGMAAAMESDDRARLPFMLRLFPLPLLVTGHFLFCAYVQHTFHARSLRYQRKTRPPLGIDVLKFALSAFALAATRILILP
jgi:hypothetical protein